MNVEIDTEAAQFFFWEYLFRIFGIVSLQHIVTSFPSVIVITSRICSRKANEQASTFFQRVSLFLSENSVCMPL